MTKQVNDSEYTTIKFVSPGFYEAYSKELKERQKLAEFFAWGNFIGWVLTIVIYEVLR